MSLPLTVLPAPACAPALMLRLHHPLSDESVPSVPAMLRALSQEERLRADRTKDGGTRTAFVIGRYLLRAFVAELLDVDRRRLTTHFTCASCAGRGPAALDHGRPGYTLDGERVPFQLSLSRAQGVVLLAALDDGAGLRVGADLETVHAVGFDGFDAVALTSAEKEGVTQLPEADQQLTRARLWARKEALVKALGTGFASWEPSALHVLGDDRVADVDLGSNPAPGVVKDGGDSTNRSPGLVAAVAVVPPPGADTR